MQWKKELMCNARCLFGPDKQRKSWKENGKMKWEMKEANKRFIFFLKNSFIEL